MSVFGRDADEILARLAAHMRRQHVDLNRAAAEAAIGRYLSVLGLPVPPTQWMMSPGDGFSEAFRWERSSVWLESWVKLLFRSGGESLSHGLGRALVRSALRRVAREIWYLDPVFHRVMGNHGHAILSLFEDASDRSDAVGRALQILPFSLTHALGDAIVSLIGASMAGSRDPEIYTATIAMLEAAEAGVWLMKYVEGGVLLIPRPDFWIENHQLHRGDGPAVQFAAGGALWYWRGVNVGREVIEAPQSITVDRIDQELNVEVRRILIERYRAGEEVSGAGAYMRDCRAERLDHDDRFGTLWRRFLPNDEPILMVEVVNRTPEPDGHFKHYWLRVDPNCSPLYPNGTTGLPQELTARAAIASTFGLYAHQYDPAVET